MIDVRRATTGDAAELVRLRGVLFGIAEDSDDDGWREASRQILIRRLAVPSPTMAGFVVDQPDGAGLAASAVGIIEERLGGPGNPSGLVGYVFNVATDPGHRRSGYARACTDALLTWFRNQGIRTVDLRATAAAEPLYLSQGFRRTADPAMRLKLPVAAVDDPVVHSEEIR
ncbi:GNAT family N-acetyltransferase [Actinoplanes sp. LDG1-06]|uniref:GNAT family N-acetyltransferase n=1 Tax=Paractinoplanes ovalisporus TaxID=2810368 RepID=A0ABS2A9M2_9ACTN|nr:GNAT family N-acetyltransferase [Actinoplanes ovalisporus]MBM2616539.1 GNAT family N-acetyltransferase [Actinoplanes ovalisporus]